MRSTPAPPYRAVIALLILCAFHRPVPAPITTPNEPGGEEQSTSSSGQGNLVNGHRVQELYLPGKPDEVHTLERAQGPMRLLMVAVRRRMYFYLHFKGKFRLKHRLNVPAGAALFDVGDADGDGNDDLIFFSGAQIHIYYQAGDGINFQRRTMFKTTGSILPAGNHSLNRFPLFYRPASQGQAALVFLPARKSFILYALTDQLQRRGEVRLQHKAYVTDRLWKNSDVRNDYYMAKVMIPKPYFEDINRDGQRDLFFYFDRYVYIYRFNVEKFTFAKSFRLPVSFSGSYGYHLDLVDFDQNGAPDLLVTVIRGSGVDIRADNYVYPGNSQGSFERDAIHFTEAGGFFYPLPAGPANRPILLSPKIDVGLAFVWSYLVQNRLRIRINQYDIVERKFQEKTSTVLAYEVAGSLLPGFAHGDFLGDKNVEFAVGIGPNRLQIYAYSPDTKAYADSPVEEINCRAYGIYSVVNLDGSDKSDLIIRYPQGHSELGYKTNMLSILLF